MKTITLLFSELNWYHGEITEIVNVTELQVDVTDIWYKKLLSMLRENDVFGISIKNKEEE